MTAKHIGIVACSGPGAALCYQTITTEAHERMGPHEHPEVSMHAFSFAEHVRLLEAGDWPAIGELMLESVNKLASIGAQFAICPDNTVHQALPYFIEASPIPWLHIADAVAQEASRTGRRRLAVLGTRFLMEGPVYRDKLDAAGLEWRVPTLPERIEINDVIFNELVFGRVADEGQARLCRIIERLGREEGCDAVVLGCTELPLAVAPEASPLPALDSTRLLARAAIARALA